MKQFITAFLFLSTMSLAATTLAAVNITSFHYVGTKATVAELCGEVSPATGKSELIKITADGGTSNPGSYHANTGKDGKFCTLLYTYSGKATAELE